MFHTPTRRTDYLIRALYHRSIWDRRLLGAAAEQRKQQPLRDRPVRRTEELAPSTQGQAA